MNEASRKDSKPQIVLRENVYRVTVQGDSVQLEHPSVRTKNFATQAEFEEEFAELQIPDLDEKFAVRTSRPPTTGQEMGSVLAIVRDRGFKKISLQKK